MARQRICYGNSKIAIAQVWLLLKLLKPQQVHLQSWIDMLVANRNCCICCNNAVMGTAMKSVKSAKFAEGGLLQDRGQERATVFRHNCRMENPL